MGGRKNSVVGSTLNMSVTSESEEVHADVFKPEAHLFFEEEFKERSCLFHIDCICWRAGHVHPD